MGDVVKLDVVSVGDGYRFEASEILDAAKNYSFHRLVVVGELEDGELYISGTANAGESLIILERAKHFIVHE